MKRVRADNDQQSIVSQIVDSSLLTDGDWAAINQLQRAYERGGQRALSAALGKLAKDPIRYFSVVGAFDPVMVREMFRDMLAERGITREDLEAIVREYERPGRLQ
jgi:hypothetical protein